ncbi:MAG TPA: hypothetical protein VN428_11245 [Bryobacteraceae bacterium]|nr:hypothetical protein [Bryobacteraceae bacterium]
MALTRREFLMSLSILFATPARALPAVRSGSFQLKVFQGFRFDDGSIGKSGSEMDLSFFYQMRRFGMISFLGASHIARFDERPAQGSITVAEVQAWDDSVAGPSPGYYALQARNGGKYYLLHLEKFENQGKAASYWLMSFSWEEFQVH